MVISFNTEVVNGLCPPDQLELLNAVDQLRLQGIDHYISLPQIIVCGDQSSGKSSVLEAISGVPFPVKSNLCTRFPTELILRRSRHTDVTVSIIPHTSPGHVENEAPSAFHEKLNGFEGLPDLIESAKVAMGISLKGKGFSKDLLRIEISGPQHPHLTIVDLPGLIHSETKQQSSSDVDLVRDVVQAYMKQPRSIILAVVSAKNDFANQVVLKLARSTDPRGKRTMGVITKPDTLVVGSGSEAMYVSLAENKEVEFDLGWHVLRNLDSEQVEASGLLLRRRNEEEAEFFARGVWRDLPPSALGVQELRTKLSVVLLRQIATELPSLIAEIDDKLRDGNERLARLGDPRATPHEQRRHLIEISQRLQSIVTDASGGNYTDAFFDDANTTYGYQQRLRAVIQQLNRDFAKEMREFGHARNIVGAGGSDSNNSGSNSGSNSDNDDDNITRDSYVAEVRELMRRTRGRELPGRFNPLIVTDLFLAQSRPWEGIVIRHVGRCWEAAKKCLKLAVASVAGGSVGPRLLHRVIVPALDELRDEVVARAGELVASQKLCHPVTYDEQYLEAVRGLHDRRRREFCAAVVERFFDQKPSASNHMNRSYVNLEDLVNQLSKRQEPDEERFAASEAVDCMQAYYSVALKRMVDDIAIEVIERKLIVALPAILSPMVVFEMEESQVSDIAGESKESRENRATWESQNKALLSGSEICKRFAGLRLDDISTPVYEEYEEDGGEREDGGREEEETEVGEEEGEEGEGEKEVDRKENEIREVNWEENESDKAKGKKKKKKAAMKKARRGNSSEIRAVESFAWS